MPVSHLLLLLVWVLLVWVLLLVLISLRVLRLGVLLLLLLLLEHHELGVVERGEGRLGRVVVEGVDSADGRHARERRRVRVGEGGGDGGVRVGV